jgi:hypothetical protein
MMRALATRQKISITRAGTTKPMTTWAVDADPITA